MEKIICKTCNKEIGTRITYMNHMRKHVQTGELTELKRKGKIIFLTKEELTKLIDNEPYALLGEEQIQKQPKEAWDITQELNQLPIINPQSYFITSGEAIQKTQKLLKDTTQLQNKTKLLLKKLIKTKGPNKYLETTKDNSRQIIKNKNSRHKEEEKDE